MKLLFFMAFMSSAMAKADLAGGLLKASDQARGGLNGGVTWNIKIESMDDGESSVREFRVKAKDHDAHVEATAPSRNKGEVYIFNDRNIWFFKPSLKKPVAISARQKLTGQAANGDIASTHYSRDYNATIEKTEVLDGQKTHVLLLKAKANNLTYDQIRYWVQDKTRLAVKAEYLTLQGKPFKVGIMKYDSEITVSGKTLPFISQLIITDAKYPQNKSTMTYSKPQAETHPASLFNVNNLSR